MSKTRSLSDQPVSCPLCGAILRQSRNLRRHLELLHFGLGNSSKSGIHARHRRVAAAAAAAAADRANDFGLSSLACVRPTARLESHLAARSSEASDFSMVTPLSIASSVSSASSVSLPGESQVIYKLSTEYFIFYKSLCTSSLFTLSDFQKFKCNYLEKNFSEYICIYREKIIWIKISLVYTMFEK